MVTCEAIWLQKLLVVLFGQKVETTMIHCDNQSCIKLSENPMFHDRSKHIDIRFHQGLCTKRYCLATIHTYR